MLKDKYRFKLSINEANLLNDTIHDMYMNYGQTKDLELQLPLAVLLDFKRRLHGNLDMPKKDVKVFLKGTEALAFRLVFLNNILEFNIITGQIATAVDRTL